jgi:hypothetical protein
MLSISAVRSNFTLWNYSRLLGTIGTPAFIQNLGHTSRHPFTLAVATSLPELTQSADFPPSAAPPTSSLARARLHRRCSAAGRNAGCSRALLHLRLLLHRLRALPGLHQRRRPTRLRLHRAGVGRLQQQEFLISPSTSTVI